MSILIQVYIHVERYPQRNLVRGNEKIALDESTFLARDIYSASSIKWLEVLIKSYAMHLPTHFSPSVRVYALMLTLFRVAARLNLPRKNK